MQGGVGAFTQELAKALARQGHDIHIMTSRAAAPASPPVGRKAGEPFGLAYARLYPFINRWRWPSNRRLVDWVLRYELDVVNIQYQPAAFNMHSAAVNLLPWRLHGMTTAVVTFHDLRLPYLFPKAGRLRQTAVNLLARKAQGVIATNSADYQALQQRGVPDSRLAQIPIGSNIEALPAQPGEVTAVRRELNLQTGDCLLGYFGFLHESKGADLLLQTLAALAENVHLIFIGGRTGSSDEANNAAFNRRLEQMVANLGLAQRVHWTGFVPAHHVSAYLNAVDLMVMPYRDGVSLRRGTLMAVLAHGRPLLTTQPPLPIPELEHGRNVWLVPVNDGPALTEAARALLAHPDRRRQLGAGAAAVAGLFSWDAIAARTLEFFQSVHVPPVAH